MRVLAEENTMKTALLPPLTAVVHRESLSDETPMWVALCPELDVASQGETVEEARAMLREAVELFLEVADDSEIEKYVLRGASEISLLQ